MTAISLAPRSMAMADRNFPAARIMEFVLEWPGAPAMPMPSMTDADAFACCLPGGGSTHELVADPDGSCFWVSGQEYDHVARVPLDGGAPSFFAMKVGSRPHGIRFDQQGQLWVTFEGTGELARLDRDGQPVECVDVGIHATGFDGSFNPRPHGLGVADDGALWFTGKLSNTVGRVGFDRVVRHFALPTIGAVPIYLAAGTDGSMWCTELGGNSIAWISRSGEVKEYPVPTAGSRPIAIVGEPGGRAMWFSEEAGGKVGRIDASGAITEYAVPLTHRDAILAGLAFDDAHNLWVQQYISPPQEGPTGDDYIVRIDAAITSAPAGDLSSVRFDFFKAPSQRTVMHRITQGPDGAMWFSELGLNRIGRVER